MNFLKQWSTKFGFPEELIAEACSRTIRAIHEPNFGYANSILEKWHKAGIHTMDAVAKADEVYQQQKSGTFAAAGHSQPVYKFQTAE